MLRNSNILIQLCTLELTRHLDPVISGLTHSLKSSDKPQPFLKIGPSLVALCKKEAMPPLNKSRSSSVSTRAGRSHSRISSACSSLQFTGTDNGVPTAPRNCKSCKKLRCSIALHSFLSCLCAGKISCCNVTEFGLLK